MQEEIENVEETQQFDETKFESAGDDSVIKVDLSQTVTEEDATTEQSTDEVPVRDESETSEEVREENVEGAVEEVTGEEEQGVQDDTPTLEEVTEEEEQAVEDLAEEAVEAVAKAQETGEPLPENIQKLVDFMSETGGDIEDYVMLNQDYSEMDNLTALQEYYKATKPHLTTEERGFLMEENFSFDEELDDEKDIRRKK